MRRGPNGGEWRTNKEKRLTVETVDLAAVFQQPLGQHGHRVGHGLAVVRTLVAVQHERALLVGVDDLLSEIGALDRGGQVDFAGSQPPQHDGRYAEVDGVAHVTVGEVHRAAAVQYEHLTLVTRRQLGGQPLAPDADVGQEERRRFVFGRHRWTAVGQRTAPGGSRALGGPG